VDNKIDRWRSLPINGLFGRQAGASVFDAGWATLRGTRTRNFAAGRASAQSARAYLAAAAASFCCTEGINGDVRI
jgi:hypothetical protein